MRFMEICCSSVEDVIEAREGGALRVELCAALSTGGLTPSYATIARAIEQKGSMAVNVLIRPREGDFAYTPDQIETMLTDIALCRQLGADGVVVGALNRDGSVDRPTVDRLVAAARPLSVTFHRAFDVCSNPFEAFEQIIESGCDRLLTSGCKPSAIEGKEMIGELVRRSRGRIAVMAGCGVRVSNIAELERATGAGEFHSSARRSFDSPMTYRSIGVSMSSDGSDFVLSRTDRHIVAELCHLT